MGFEPGVIKVYGNLPPFVRRVEFDEVLGGVVNNDFSGLAATANTDRKPQQKNNKFWSFSHVDTR